MWVVTGTSQQPQTFFKVCRSCLYRKEKRHLCAEVISGESPEKEGACPAGASAWRRLLKFYCAVARRVSCASTSSLVAARNDDRCCA
eukprot:5015535-Prymnesium_polylepis.1